MRDKLLQTLRQEIPVTAGDTVVCALSGGADSVALLHGLLAVKDELGITVKAAHFNHCLRGEESEADEAFVRQLCARWGAELTVGRGDPCSCAGKSPEEAARDLRYAFLLEQEGWIATAHHGDDQVETVLLQLLRGTGLKGLCGMAVRQGRVIRPLLNCSRQELRDYVQCHDLPFRQDSSNDADDALRNRLRHHVIPLLSAENPNLTGTVSRMTRLLRQDEAYLQQQVDELLEKAAADGGYRVPILLEAPEVLRRRAIRQLLTIPKPAMHHVEAVETLLGDLRGSASIELPDGWLAVREYDRLAIVRRQETGFQPVRLTAGEIVRIPALGLQVTCTAPAVLEYPADNRSAFAIRWDGRLPEITIRPRQSGDAVQLSGGRKTVKKWMIDRKIPASGRGQLPVLEDEQGVFAVYGLGADCTRSAKVGETAWIIHFITEERKP